MAKMNDTWAVYEIEGDPALEVAIRLAIKLMEMTKLEQENKRLKAERAALAQRVQHRAESLSPGFVANQVREKLDKMMNGQSKNS
jgi:hypothetical protein